MKRILTLLLASFGLLLSAGPASAATCRPPAHTTVSHLTQRHTTCAVAVKVARVVYDHGSFQPGQIMMSGNVFLFFSSHVWWHCTGRQVYNPAIAFDPFFSGRCHAGSLLVTMYLGS